MATASASKSPIPTMAIKGLMGYKTHIIAPPMTMKIRDITTPITASIIPLKVSPPDY